MKETTPSATHVTVVVTSFNCAPYLPSALEGILAQTLQPERVIVVDDCSTDDSSAVAQQYAARYPHFVAVSTPTNAGAATARNLGLSLATTTWVALLDGDDIWRPQHLETVVALAAQCPSAAMVFTLVRSFGSRSHVWGAALPDGEPSDAFWPSVRYCVAQTSAVMIHRQRAASIGNFDQRWRFGEDFDFYLRLSRTAPFALRHEVTVEYRKHPRGASAKVERSVRGEYDVRWAMYKQLQSEQSAQIDEFAAVMREVYHDRFVEFWSRREGDLLKFLDSLVPLVPGGAEIAARWRVRRYLLPLARVMDLVRGRQRAST